MQSPLLDVWLGWLIVTSVIVTSVSGPSPRMMWVCSFVVPGVKSLISFTRWISVLLPSWMPRQSWAPLSPENRITDCVPRPCAYSPPAHSDTACHGDQANLLVNHERLSRFDCGFNDTRQ